MSTPTITDEQIAEIEDGIPCGRTIGHGACGELGFICARCEQSASLISRLRAAERDAARYRWLRSREAECNVEIPSVDGCGYLLPGYLDLLDAEIDAAMARPEPNHPA